MAQYQITEIFELLHHLFLKNTKELGMAEFLESVLNQIIKAQATGQLEAEYYERTNTRQGYRNGTYPHTLSTRVGSLTLKVPPIRNGEFSTDLFTRFQTLRTSLYPGSDGNGGERGLHPQGGTHYPGTCVEKHSSNPPERTGDPHLSRPGRSLCIYRIIRTVIPEVSEH